MVKKFILATTHEEISNGKEIYIGYGYSHELCYG